MPLFIFFFCLLLTGTSVHVYSSFSHLSGPSLCAVGPQDQAPASHSTTVLPGPAVTLQMRGKTRHFNQHFSDYITFLGLLNQ